MGQAIMTYIWLFLQHGNFLSFMNMALVGPQKESSFVAVSDRRSIEISNLPQNAVQAASTREATKSLKKGFLDNGMDVVAGSSDLPEPKHDNQILNNPTLENTINTQLINKLSAKKFNSERTSQLRISNLPAWMTKESGINGSIDTVMHSDTSEYALSSEVQVSHGDRNRDIHLAPESAILTNGNKSNMEQHATKNKSDLGRPKTSGKI